MSQQRQSSGPISELDGPDTLRRRGRAAGFAMVSITALALGAFGVGAMHVSPARTTDALERLSAAWDYVLSTIHPTLPHLPAAQLPAVLPDVEPRRAVAARQPEPLADPVPAAAFGQGHLVPGDRLKVTFFESVAVSLGDLAQRPDAPGPVAIFPRMDLSGEYVVDEAGGLDIPRLGWRAAAGAGVGALETQLAAAFRRSLGRSADVHVAVVDRRPVYVLGGPRGGATIKHAPGMIVLHALAEAGGFQRDVQDTSRTIEAMRETQRLGEAQDRLARALIRQARLAAVRDGLSAVPVTPATAALLLETAEQEVGGLLREADAGLATERRMHAERLALADRQVEIATRELAAQNLRATQARVLAETKASRLHDLERIAARGSVSQFKLMDTAVEVSEALARQEDLRATTAQAGSRLVEAEIARARLVEAQTSQNRLELAASALEVADLQRAVGTMRAVIAVLGDGQVMPSKPGSKPGSGSPGLRIVRPAPGGTILITASDTTPLNPGDVLQIGPDRAWAPPSMHNVNLGETP